MPPAATFQSILDLHQSAFFISELCKRKALVALIVSLIAEKEIRRKPANSSKRRLRSVALYSIKNCVVVEWFASHGIKKSKPECWMHADVQEVMIVLRASANGLVINNTALVHCACSFAIRAVWRARFSFHVKIGR